MIKTLELFRVEHVRCAENPGHGPGLRYYDCRYDQETYETLAPEYGRVGQCPNRIDPDEYCAVTAGQLPYWWGSVDDLNWNPDFWAQNGWYFVKYVVAVDKAREDNKQFLFRKQDAISREIVHWNEIAQPANSYSDRHHYHFAPQLEYAEWKYSPNQILKDEYVPAYKFRFEERLLSKINYPQRKIVCNVT